MITYPNIKLIILKYLKITYFLKIDILVRNNKKNLQSKKARRRVIEQIALLIPCGMLQAHVTAVCVRTLEKTNKASNESEI